ncbi:MAG TPA: cbb3-type cytochrome c oxidase subunit II, partial [Gemmatales bacterium]|nr:cbb3-type cytochrome c oxidase subunit II [Gemmatales bacterium]
MFESKHGVLMIAGLFSFALAFVASGLVPWIMYADRPELTAEDMVHPRVIKNENMLIMAHDLARRYRGQFNRHIGILGSSIPRGSEASTELDAEVKIIADALRVARKVYIGEGCWHCHSQFVRGVSNEVERWGPVSNSWEYGNELQRPVMFGTRRVGPDLIREGGRRSNDWHAAHFYDPRSTSPESVMPTYPWFFDTPADFFASNPPEPTMDWERAYFEQLRGLDQHQPTPLLPNKRGLAMILYMQWLGSW